MAVEKVTRKKAEALRRMFRTVVAFVIVTSFLMTGPASAVSGLSTTGPPLASTVAEESVTPSSISFDPTIQKMMDEVTAAELFRMDSEIVNRSMPDRYHGTTRLDTVRAWLANYAETNGGPRLRTETWYTNQSDTYKSLRIIVPGEDPTAKWVITTGGHMDTVRNAPGADDDGSGTVGAVLTCTILSRYRLRATVECFGWDGHECCWPNPSSYDYATTMKQASVDIKAYFNQDMISYDPNNEVKTNVIGREADRYLYTQTQQIVQNYNTGLTLAAYDPGDTASDQVRFHQAGYDGIFFIENTFNTPNYHKPTDTMDKVNMKLAEAVVKAVIGNIATMAEVMTGGAAVRIDVTPKNASIPAGQKLALSAQGFDVQGNPIAINSKWSANAGSIAQNGEFSAPKTGAYTVWANTTTPPLAGSTQVFVVPGPLGMIDVTPDTAAMNADDTRQFAATGTDAYGNAVQVSPQWGASGGAVSGSGLYSAGPVGAWSVYGNDSGVSGSAIVTVSAGKPVSLKVVPANAIVRADSDLTFMATVRDSDANPVPATSAWSSTGGSIDTTGRFTPERVGDFEVAAAAAGLTAQATVKVTPGHLHAVKVAPATLRLTVGERAELTLSAEDVKGNDIPSFTADWSVSELGEFSGTGAAWSFVAREPGSMRASVQVSSEGVTKSAEVEIVVEAKPLVPGFGNLLGGNGAWIVILLVAVAAVAMVALLAMRRRKRRTSQVAPAYYAEGSAGPIGGSRSSP